MLRRSRRLLSGNRILRGRLLPGANFRTAQPRRHFSDRRFVQCALAHGDFGDGFIDRSVPIVFQSCRGRVDVGALFVRWRYSCSGAQVAIGAAQMSAFVAIGAACASVLIAERVLFRSPLFVVGGTEPLPPRITAPALFFAVTDARALRRKAFRVTGAGPRIGSARGHRGVSLAREALSPFICG